MGFDKTENGYYVGGRAHETRRNVVEALIDREFNVALVLFAENRNVWMDADNVYVFPAAERAAVLRDRGNFTPAVRSKHKEIHEAVCHENAAVGFYFLRKFFPAQRNPPRR